MAFPAKVAALFILFLMTFTFGLLPFGLIRCLKKRHYSRRKTDFFVGLLNCLSGGVFFGTAILHLLPESMESIENSISTDYPVAGALVGAGFLLVLSVEHTIGAIHGHGHSHAPPKRQQSKENSKTTSEVYKNNVETKFEKGNSIASISFSRTNSIDAAADQEEPKTADNKDESTEQPVSTVSDAIQTDDDDERKFQLRIVVLALALSLHMIFEGLAVGLQETDYEVWKLLGILTLHKCTVAFSLGLQLEESLHKFKRVVLSISGFSIVAPLGVGIGYLVTEYGGGGAAQGIASGVLQSLATGTFLYVTFFEILQKELSQGYNLLKVLFTIVGFLVIIGLEFLPDEDGNT